MSKSFTIAARLLMAIHAGLPTSAEEAVSPEEYAAWLTSRGVDVSEDAVEPALWFLTECGCVEAHKTPMARFSRPEGKGK